VVPVRKRDERVEVLLVTNNSGQRWVLPKGLVEAHLSAAESAAVEAYEEVGIQGSVSLPRIGTYQYEKWHGACRVEVFLMRVDKELVAWPEQASRRRRWMPLDEARRVLDERVPRTILDAAAQRCP